jgi:hypothetical protein
MKKLYICGLQGGGKSLLHQLLDGHPEIFVPGFISCPGLSLLSDDFSNRYLPHRENLRSGDQDFWYQFFKKSEFSINSDNRSWKLTVGDLWSYLFRNEVYNVQFDTEFADWTGLNKSYPDTAQDFSFTGFFREATDRVLSRGKFPDIESLQDVIYEACRAEYKNYPWPVSDQQYFLQRSNHNGIQPIKDILRRNESRKILVLSRAFPSSALMNAERLAERFPQIRAGKRWPIDKLIGSGFENALYSRKYVDKYNRFYEELDTLAGETTDLFIIDFERMVLDTERTMRATADFLQIQNNQILNQSTLNGIPISHPTGVFDVGSIKHDPRKLLTEKQVRNLGLLRCGTNLRPRGRLRVSSMAIRLLKWYAQPVLLRSATTVLKIWRSLTPSGRKK